MAPAAPLHGARLSGPSDVVGAAASPAPRRRAGLLLALFGAVGIALLGTMLWVVAGPVDDEVGPFGIEQQRRQLVALLDATDLAIDDAEVAVANADVSLRSSADAAASAGTFMEQLGAALRNSAASLRVNVFGSQPFAPVADDFERVAAQADQVATDLGSASTSIAAAATDLGTLADDLGMMRGEIDRIRGNVDEPFDTTWRMLLAALFLWLLAPAVVSLVVGLRWMRPDGPRAGRRQPTSTSPPLAARTDAPD